MTTTKFWYKQWFFPAILKGEDVAKDMIESANKFIIQLLKDNISLEDQKQYFQQQLLTIKKCVRDEFGDCDETTDAKKIKRHIQNCADKLEMTSGELKVLWNICVCALLKLKVIKNDENNGIEIIKKNREGVVFEF
jgi:hypothetical protein